MQPCLAASVLDSHRASDFKRYLARVNIVVAAVEERYLDVNYWVTSKNSTLKGLFDSLVNWLDLFLWNYTTLYLVNKLIPASWRQRLDTDNYMPVLPTTTGLLDVLSFHLTSAGDGLAVGNLWLT